MDIVTNVFVDRNLPHRQWERLLLTLTLTTSWNCALLVTLPDCLPPGYKRQVTRVDR